MKTFKQFLEQWYANPTSQSTDSSGTTTTTFTTPSGKKQIVKQTKVEKEQSEKINREYKPKPGDSPLF
jgi:hypothetical protein